MKNYGGYLRGPWWRYITDDELKVRRLYAIAWGNIVIDPSDQYQSERSVRFVIKTGRGSGRNEKHLKCVCYGDRLAGTIMRVMEKQDIVFVAGTWVESKFETKKGAKAMYELQVNFIVPLTFVTFMLDLFNISAKMAVGLPRFLYGLYMDDELRKIAEKNADKFDEADVWESD